MNEEVGRVAQKVEAVLVKFDGDPEDGVIRERITLVDDELVSHEFFDEQGNQVDEGGK